MMVVGLARSGLGMGMESSEVSVGVGKRDGENEGNDEVLPKTIARRQ